MGLNFNLALGIDFAKKLIGWLETNIHLAHKDGKDGGKGITFRDTLTFDGQLYNVRVHVEPAGAITPHV